MEPHETTQRMLRTPQAAAYLGLSPSLLEKWRAAGEGPTFVHAGRVILYDRSDLDSWIAAQKVDVSPASTAGRR